MNDADFLDRFTDEPDKFSFDAPWPDIGLTSPTDAKCVYQELIEGLETRIAGMLAFSDDPDGELRKARADVDKTEQTNSETVIANVDETERAGSETVTATVDEIERLIDSGAAPTLGALDDLIRVDADSVHRIERAMTRPPRSRRIRSRIPASVHQIQMAAFKHQNDSDDLTESDRRLWDDLLTDAWEEFDVCIEWAAFDEWKKKATSFPQMVNEAAAAGTRKWIRQVLATEFPLESPKDAVWFFRLLADAARYFDAGHTDTTLRGYDEDDIIRLAWPLLKAGPFLTDPVDLVAARKAWNEFDFDQHECFIDQAGVWHEEFLGFLESEALRKWKAFLKRLSTTPDPGRHPMKIERSRFYMELAKKAAPVIERAGVPDSIFAGKSGSIPDALDMLTGALLTIDDWPQTHKCREPATSDKVKGAARKTKRPPRESAIVSHGNRRYSIAKSEAVRLSQKEDDLLQFFLQNPRELSRPELESALRHVSTPAKVMKNIVEKHPLFAPAAQFPIEKGSGKGYFLRVVLSQSQRNDGGD